MKHGISFIFYQLVILFEEDGKYGCIVRNVHVDTQKNAVASVQSCMKYT